MFSQGSFLDAYDAEADKKVSAPPPTIPEDDFLFSKDPLSTTTTTKEPPPPPPPEPESEEEPDWATAPPMEYISENVQGYEMVSFDAVSVPPPPPPPPPDTTEDDETATEGQEKKIQEVKAPLPPIILDCDSRINEEQAKAALLMYLSKHCCYGKGAARNMVVKQMEFVPAYHYELQTFAERRETSWTYAPLKSGLPESTGGFGIGGAPPLPWDIEEYPYQPFKDEVRMVAVPNTSSVKNCHRCRGSGGVTCRECHGKGWSRCIHCHGDGWMGGESGMRDRCFYCHHSKYGHGQQDCSKCNSKGKVNCAMCDGQGQIRCYIQLTITWKVHTLEHIVEKLELPTSLIREVSGQVAYEEEAPKIYPLDRVDDVDIREASTKLVTNHDIKLADQKIVCQRHQIRIVPITRVTYEYNGRQHQFHVYGYENKAYVKKYPQNCCWGCNVL